MQETLTTEIYNQIDCMKLHLRNMQEVAEVEKMLPVNCLELHKGISAMEQALVHFMNFEKLLKSKCPIKDEKKKRDHPAVSPVTLALDAAVAMSEKVFLSFNEQFMQGISEADKSLYYQLSQENCFVLKNHKCYILNYAKGSITIPVDQILDFVTKVKPAF